MSSSNQSIRPADAQIQREAGAARISFTIPESFVFCRGHFPDQPIVPGAVLAAWMLEAADLIHDGASSRQLQNLKFRSPLVPGEPVAVRADSGPAGVRVTVHSLERLCADAVFLP